jgi:general stress protein 26
MTMTSEAPSELRQILEGFETAVLLTHCEDDPAKMHGRPMRIAALDDQDRVWFFAAIDSGKVREALAHDDAYVVCQSKEIQAVLHGRLSVTQDRDRIRELWIDVEEPFFREGSDDPRVCLLCFSPGDGDYWTDGGTA